MNRTQIRVEPISTYLERYRKGKAFPVIVAGETIYVSGLPPFDPVTGEVVPLTAPDFADLCRIHLYDWLEQVPRSRRGYGYRRAAYRQIAERLGPEAVAAHDRVCADEPRWDGGSP